MDQLLNELVARLKEAFGSELTSVVLYGSAALAGQPTKGSDLNIICVLPQVRVGELKKAEKVVQWWTAKQKQPAPLFLSASEIECRADIFPIEFIDIQQNRRVLHGADLFAGIQFDHANHRAQLEHEISSNLLRLRQRYLMILANDKDVVRLMTGSISSVATVTRHSLMIAGHEAPSAKHEIFEAAAARFGMNAAPFLAVLRLREGGETLSGGRVHDLFAAYLAQITALEEILDKM